MKDEIMNILDRTGLLTVLASVYMNITGFFNIQSWNIILVFITSFIGIIYLGMKIYHQWLITKEKRKELGRNGIF